MRADIHPDYVVATVTLLVRQHLHHPLDEGRPARRALQRVPPLLHGQAEAGGHRRPHRPLRAPLRQAPQVRRRRSSADCSCVARRWPRRARRAARHAAGGARPRSPEAARTLARPLGALAAAPTSPGGAALADDRPGCCSTTRPVARARAGARRGPTARMRPSCTSLVDADGRRAGPPGRLLPAPRPPCGQVDRDAACVAAEPARGRRRRRRPVGARAGRAARRRRPRGRGRGRHRARRGAGLEVARIVHGRPPPASRSTRRCSRSAWARPTAS